VATAHTGSWLGDVDPALGSSFQPFNAFREQFGFVPKLFWAQALLPRVIEAEGALISAILFTDKALARAQKECILLVLSAANGNAYCFGLHYQMLKLLGVTAERLDHIVADFQAADLSPTNKALVNFTLKLSTSGASISREDVSEASSQGLTDESLLEAILTAALSSLLCILSTGVGAIPDFATRLIPLSVRAPSARDGPSSAGDGKSEFYLHAPEMNPGDFTAFAFLHAQFGFVPNVFRAQTLRPDVLEAEAFAIRSILAPEDALTRAQKERILLAGEPSQAHLERSDGVLPDFARKLSAGAPEFSTSDILALQEQGFTQEQILEAVVTASLACFFNVLQTGLGAAPDFAARWSPQSAAIIAPAKKANLSGSDHRQTDVALLLDADAECVARIQSGDLDLFEELMNRYGQRVYRTLIGILRNPDEARDAMQDTFLKAFQHLSGFEGRSKFSTWLLSIATNTGLERLRRRRPIESLDESSPDEEGFRPRQVQAWTDDPEQLYSQAERRTLIEHGVMALPVKYRVVVMLRDIEQLSAEEAASALGLGIPAIKSRLLRGRLMLREALAYHFISSEGRGKAKGGNT
jgi:RNA polymerase sigma-70 factor (ECF subfamily)